MIETFDMPLSPLTTLGLGGPGARVVEVFSEQELRDVVVDADSRGEALFVLSGGSNVVVSDAGWPGVVLRPRLTSWTERVDGDEVQLCVGAGWVWDALVETSVGRGWSGLACLSGIPGWAGAAPIQNIGAYGHEVADVLEQVRVFDREQRGFRVMSRQQCALGYRTSRFRQDQRFVVVGMTLRLRRESHELVRYHELARALGIDVDQTAPLSRVREAVIALRRTKGMVVDEADPESRSAGSFFVNPVVTQAELRYVQQQAVARGAVDRGARVPFFSAGQERFKLSAAWLIEAAGFRKGQTHGAVAISRKHALALVNRGGTTAQLLELEKQIREAVQDTFGVCLRREPTLVTSSGVCEVQTEAGR